MSEASFSKGSFMAEHIPLKGCNTALQKAAARLSIGMSSGVTLGLRTAFEFNVTRIKFLENTA
jgi:hypothetical protein